MEAAEITRDDVFFILPLWLAAGFADYLCHRGSDIEHTSGFKESLLHLLQFAVMAVPIMAVMFLEVNALIILLMIVSFKPLTQEARQRGAATLQARADAFARSMAGTIEALEREGITSSWAMAKALNERGVPTARSGRWDVHTVLVLRRRLKRLGL